jgi:hypothetical protein
VGIPKNKKTLFQSNDSKNPTSLLAAAAKQKRIMPGIRKTKKGLSSVAIIHVIEVSANHAYGYLLELMHFTRKTGDHAITKRPILTGPESCSTVKSKGKNNVNAGIINRLKLKLDFSPHAIATRARAPTR